MNTLITGASSGLGLHLFHRFGAQDIFGTFGTTADMNATADRIIYWDAMQSTKFDDYTLAQRLQPADGPGPTIKVLINNAGINAIRKFEDLHAGFIHDVMQVNAVAPVLLIQQLLKQKFIGEGTVICNVISDAAWRPMRHSLAYNCSKAALDMATKQMARELTKPYGLTIFGVRPGKLRGTGMSRYIDEQVCELRGWSDQQAREYFKQNSLSGEEMDPALVADLIFHLCTSNLPISGACLDLVG